MQIEPIIVFQRFIFLASGKDETKMTCPLEYRMLINSIDKTDG